MEMTMKKMAIFAVCLSAVACGDELIEENQGTETGELLDLASPAVTVTFDNLPSLGEDFVYEGWLVTDGVVTTAGRFADTETTFTFEISDAETAASLYVLTIEPEFGDDPAPSAVHLLGGRFSDGVASLSVDHSTAIGTGFDQAGGRYILAAPTSADIADYSKGIWFGSQLSLPPLATGWTYEGWIVGDEGPISTGRFRSLDRADSDGPGPTAGPLAAPNIPGQDFIDPPMVLLGATVVISVEPMPDDDPAPFALKPLIDPELTDVGDHGLQAFVQNLDELPTGTAFIE